MILSKLRRELWFGLYVLTSALLAVALIWFPDEQRLLQTLCVVILLQCAATFVYYGTRVVLWGLGHSLNLIRRLI